MSKWIAPFILGLAGVIVLCALGIWQVQRLEWKENIIASLNAQMQSAPTTLGALEPLSENLSGTPFHARGEILDEHTDLLSGDKKLGAGYRRIFVFESGGERWLLEAGFLPEAAKSTRLPVPATPLDIQGHIYVPSSAHGSYAPARDIWVGYNLPAMAELLDANPVILVASAAPIQGLGDTPMTINLPNNHRQYAITWFSLAIVWGMMAFYWGYKRNKE